MKTFWSGLVVIGMVSGVSAQTPAGAQQGGGQKPTASVNTGRALTSPTMPRPIDMHDSVWIEDLTMLEVRDLIKAGKTTAVMLTGGIEENGPYLTTGKHNNVLSAQGESIARRARQRAGRADRDTRARQPVAAEPLARHGRPVAGDLSRRAHRHGHEPPLAGLHRHRAASATAAET